MVQTRSGKKTAPVEGMTHSTASEEEMGSPHSGRNQGQQVEDDIDPQMYIMFKKMMTKMLAEQAEASTEQTQIKQKAKGRAMKESSKAAKKSIQYADVDR